jgi:hypothetical protein
MRNHVDANLVLGFAACETEHAHRKNEQAGGEPTHDDIPLWEAGAVVYGYTLRQVSQGNWREGKEQPKAGG